MGVTAPATWLTQSKPGSAATPCALSSHRATFSSAGSQEAQTASDTDTDVRMDKVSSIQAALASGTYSVPSSAVASKMMEAMLGSHE
ncbi:MAG: flagellar biosynthesis anti-sigma factor FlgM [Terracidiphilus sp.]